MSESMGTGRVDVNFMPNKLKSFCTRFKIRIRKTVLKGVGTRAFGKDKKLPRVY